MTSDKLTPDIQLLQRDVLELLRETSALMRSAATQLSSREGAENKYSLYQEQIDKEIRKVENLELRMAIAAPMKAGKSTIINAIVGQDLLPSRNAAMTTIPTELRLRRDLNEPVLILAPQTLELFEKTWETLREVIEKDESEDEIFQKVAEYPHLKQLVEKIKGSIRFPIQSETQSHEAIIEALSRLNDVIRLCSRLAPLSNPLNKLEDIPRIETPFCPLKLGTTDFKSEALGNLVIVDTPGPNEAGENLDLIGVVRRQLQESSLVLIVLDYTQLKTQAAESVKDHVQRVIQIKGQENLYILINKVDQRKDPGKDMSSKEVQEFVAAQFGFDKDAIKNRVFEISARQAFTTSSFKQDVESKPNVDVKELKTMIPFAQEVFGPSYKSKLKRSNSEKLLKELRENIEFLWEESGFDSFLNTVISALMIEAAPRCLDTALSVAENCLINLLDCVKLRRNGISKDVQLVEAEIDKLKQDLKSLAECRKQVSETIEGRRKKLNKKLDETIEDLRVQSQSALKESFFSRLYQGNRTYFV